MNKKASHIGMVISFVIFVGFLFSIYIIVTPAIKVERMGNIVDIVKENIVSETSSEITFCSLKISGEGSCFILNDFFTESELGDKLLINEKDSSLKKSEDNLYINNIQDNVIKIYFSEKFSNISQGTFGGCTDLGKGSGYSFGLMKKEEIPLEKEIKDIFKNYSDDYNLLKTRISVPENNDVELKFIYPNKTILYANNSVSELKTSIFLKKFYIEYFSEVELKKEIGIIEIKLW